MHNAKVQSWFSTSKYLDGWGRSGTSFTAIMYTHLTLPWCFLCVCVCVCVVGRMMQGEKVGFISEKAMSLLGRISLAFHASSCKAPSASGRCHLMNFRL